MPLKKTESNKSFPVKSKAILYIFIFLFVTILVVLNQSIYKQSQVITNLPVEPSPTINPTANWQTYNNAKLGISLKYPNNWKVLVINAKQGEVIKFITQDNSSETGIYIDSQNSLSSKYLKNKINLPNIEAYRYTIAGALPKEVVSIKLLNGKILNINQDLLETSNITPGTFDQILNTFKFTN
jgi:hypothetical protein